MARGAAEKGTGCVLKTNLPEADVTETPYPFTVAIYARVSPTSRSGGRFVLESIRCS